METCTEHCYCHSCTEEELHDAGKWKPSAHFKRHKQVQRVQVPNVLLPNYYTQNDFGDLLPSYLGTWTSGKWITPPIDNHESPASTKSSCSKVLLLSTCESSEFDVFLYKFYSELNSCSLTDPRVQVSIQYIYRPQVKDIGTPLRLGYILY